MAQSNVFDQFVIHALPRETLERDFLSAMRVIDVARRLRGIDYIDKAIEEFDDECENGCRRK